MPCAKSEQEAVRVLQGGLKVKVRGLEWEVWRSGWSQALQAGGSMLQASSQCGKHMMCMAQ